MRTIMHRGRPFWMPVDPTVLNPRHARSIGVILASAAHRVHVNLVRPSLGYTMTGQPAIIQFVYLTHPTSLFRTMPLQTGHFPTPQETQEGSAFVSSSVTGEGQQIGQLRSAGAVQTTIKPLVDLPQSDMPWTGEYWVETSSTAKYQQFVQQVVNEMNARFVPHNAVPYTASNFTQGSPASLTSATAFAVWGSGFFQYVAVIEGILVALTIIFMVYYGFSVAKTVGIFKLNGWSTISIWYAIVGKTVLIWAITSASLSLIVGVVLYGTSAWIIALMATTAETYGLILLASGIFALYVSRIRIGDAVKQHRRTGGIFAMNTGLKILGIVLLLVLGTATWNEYSQLNSQVALLNQWHHHRTTHAYGVMYPITSGHNLLNVMQGNPGIAYVEARWLYPLLDHQGALYLDTRSYTESALSLPQSPGYVRMVTVNPNYLHTYPVETLQHKPVTVSDRTTAWVVLVPNEYRNHVTAIRQYVQQERANTLQAEALVFHTPVPRTIQHQTIRIVWISNHQRLFSWNPTVFPSQNNIILNPIIQVQTLGNTVPADWVNAVNGSVAAPLKVPLIHGNAGRTENELTPVLDRLHLHAYIHSIVPVQRAIQERIHTLQQGLARYLAIGAGLVATAIILIVQNARVLFTQYQKRFLVRRLFGHGRLSSYREYFGIVGLTWIGQVVVAFAIAGEKALILAAPLIIVDGVISTLTLASLERYHLAQKLKEGI